MNNEAITERAQILLKLLIETYILNGQPVGSQYLAKRSELAVSSATVRNILSDLEAMGLLTSPHTSAGRVPTEQGYRFFVNSLLKTKDIDTNLFSRCQQELTAQRDHHQLVQSTSKLLSDITNLAGMVSLPQPEQTILRHIEFLPLSNRRLLVILVINQSEVQNRIIEVERDFKPQELEQISNYLCEQFAGQDITKIRQQIILDLKQDQDRMTSLMQTAIGVAERAILDDKEPLDYVVAGQEHLLGLADEAGIDKLKHVFSAFTEKQQILSIFDKCIEAKGLQIFIGEESGFPELASCSVIAAPYNIDGQAVGVLGVVGPTRIPYQQVIPMVDITAKILSSVLNMDG